MTARNLQLSAEVLLDAVIGQELVLGQIDRMGFEAVAVLNSAVDALGKGRGEGLAAGVFEDFGAILGDDQGDIQIEDLARFETDRLIMAFWQGATVNAQYPHCVGIIDRFQGAANVTVLSTRLTFTLAFPSARTVGIGRGRLAAIAVEVQPIE